MVYEEQYEIEPRVSASNEELPATDKQARYIRFLTYNGMTRKQASQAIEILKGEG